MIRAFPLAFAALLMVVPAAGGAEGPTPPRMPADDEEGFVSLFNGTDLEGWDGNPDLWSVKDGVIHGETTPEKPTKGNTFLIWRGGEPKNFVLKIEFRIENGNSGIQYRSREVAKWVISGYQAEVENKPGKVGFLYHEKGRGWLVNVGDVVVIDPEGKKHTVSKVADTKNLVDRGYYKEKDWNEYTIICRGNHVVHLLNGYQTVELIDQDKKGRCMEGLLALQIHAGPPMVVEFRDIRLKTLPDHFGEARMLFNGEDLSGWMPMSEAVADTFGVADGVITNTGKPSGYLRTEETFTSYALRLQLKHEKAGNSGILLRIQPPEKVWPKSIEAQGQKDNLGDIWNIDQFPMKVDADRTKGRRTVKLHPSNEFAVGQWNRYDITLSGGDLVIRANGLIQNTATEVETIPGWIGLQSEGTPLRFRNVVLIPIDAAGGGE